MYSNITIRFTINPYRKYKETSIDPTLSQYWNDMYKQMFRGWK